MEPYRGLQPYTEQDESIFFGREAEKAILIDKMLSDKLTLLFAASGVGKSSLLQAAVMPELKRPSGENLDVVYYHDWVINPLDGLQQAVLHLLQERGKLSPPSDTQAAASPSLKEFLQRCAEVASEPLVIILDQFEEFFQYQQYAAAFTPFIEQLAEAIRDRATPVVFLISMREDFALNLNAFKENLPNIFDHYYRLEKLSIQTAETAIRKPVENLNFRYEPELLAMLLRDLADEERENRIGTQKAEIPDHAPRFVEAPNVQIVCTQLWEMERTNPERMLRANTYTEHGGVKGFITIYFERVMTDFSAAEKRIASKAFDHLVTPRGTKMAYPVKDLSDKLREDEHALANVLAKLDKARVLRGQSRAGVIWYELYHDVFSGIIYQWNSRYKEQQRNKRALIGAGIALFIAVLGIVAYDVVINLTSHHLRVSLKTDASGQYLAEQIEVYRGNAQSWDIFGLQSYEAEADYGHQELEPDKFFSDVKPVADYQDLNAELIGQLPLVDRIQAYWQDGELQKALDLADKSINPNDVTRSQSVIPMLARFPDQRAFEILQAHVKKTTNGDMIRSSIATWLGYSRFSGVEDYLISLLQDPIISVRQNAAAALGQIKNDRAVEPLVQALQDQSEFVRGNAAAALGQIKNDRAVEPLVQTLREQNAYVRQNAAAAFGQIKSKRAIDLLLQALQDQNEYMRQGAAAAFAQIKSEQAIDVLLQALQDQNKYVRQGAAVALGQIGSERAVESLVQALQDQDIDVRRNAATALGQIGSDRAVNPLLQALQDQNEYMRQGVVVALGQIKSEQAIDTLLQALKNQNADVRQGAAVALGQIGSDRAIDALLQALQDQDANVRGNAATALGQIGSERVVELLVLILQDRNPFVRGNAAVALGQIGDERIVESLLQALQDQNEYMRQGVVVALGQIGNDRAIDALLQALQDQNPFVRGNAAVALGQFGSDRAIDALLQALQDQYTDVRGNAEEALGQVGSDRAVDALLQALQDQWSYVRHNTVAALARLDVPPILYSQFIKPTIFYDEFMAPFIPNIRFIEKSEKLSILSVTELPTLRVKLKTANIARREAIAEQLGNSPSKESNAILLSMLNDPNFRVHRAVVAALANIAAPESLNALQSIALNPAERFVVRQNAIKGIGKIGADAAAAMLLNFLDQSGDLYRFRTVQALGNTRSPNALPKLLAMLQERQARAAQWRRIRDEQTDIYTEQKIAEWRTRLNAVAPDLTLEFELAHSIAMIDPEEGVKLLSHDLAKVRKGAWLGLARLPLTKTRPFALTAGIAAVNLIERLDRERMASGNPFFKHAAYRAIDGMLISIEAYGGKPELDALQTFLPNAQDAEGVKTRVEWTIDRLKENEESHRAAEAQRKNNMTVAPL